MNDDTEKPVVAITDADFASVYEWAMGYAERRAVRFAESVGPLVDAATSGILWARSNCAPVSRRAA